MPKEVHESNKEASRELTRILEETVTAGADCLELERENQELVAYQYLGNTGVGAVAIPETLQEAVIKEIVNRAPTIIQKMGLRSSRSRSSPS